jgi:hypothetical protein
MSERQPTPALRYLRTLLAAPADEAAPDGGLLQRFVRQHEEGAFAALVGRHGPILLLVPMLPATVRFAAGQVVPGVAVSRRAVTLAMVSRVANRPGGPHPNAWADSRHEPRVHGTIIAANVLPAKTLPHGVPTAIHESVFYRQSATRQFACYPRRRRLPW